MSRSTTSKVDPGFTPRRSSRRSSLGSPARVRRLSALVQQFKDTNMDSFASTPGRSILSDNTDIEQPRRQSWWKKLDDNNSRDIIEALGNEKVDNANNVLEELDVEILSQEKERRNFSLDLPDSSGSETIDSIIIPDRKLFTQKENVPQKKFSKMFGPRESLANLYKPNTEKIKDINTVGPKKLFSQAPRDRHKIFEKVQNSPIKLSQDDLIVLPKKIFNQENLQRKTIFPDIINSSPKKSSDILEPVAGPKNLFHQKTKERKSIFPLALLETSADKTGNKTTELHKEQQGQVRSLFGNRPTTKRKNMFADFIVVEKEDEVPDIQPTSVFGFPQKPEEMRRGSSSFHALTDAEDDKKMLPSSTMMDHMEGLTSPVKRPKLSTIPRERESEEPREAHVLTDDDIVAEGSGWDSHRTTRKTLRQTFGKDFTPRKSLRALVMEKSAKRQTENPIRESVGYPQANSTEILQNLPKEVAVVTSANNAAVDDAAVDNIADIEYSPEVSIRTSPTTLVIEKSAKGQTENPIRESVGYLQATSAEIKQNFTVPKEAVVVTSADSCAVINAAVDNIADIDHSAIKTSDSKTPDVSIRTSQTTVVMDKSSKLQTEDPIRESCEYPPADNTAVYDAAADNTAVDDTATDNIVDHNSDGDNTDGDNTDRDKTTADNKDSTMEASDLKTPELCIKTRQSTFALEKSAQRQTENPVRESVEYPEANKTADIEHSRMETSELKTPELCIRTSQSDFALEKSAKRQTDNPIRESVDYPEADIEYSKMETSGSKNPQLSIKTRQSSFALEKSAKQESKNPIRESVGYPQANSTEILHGTVPQEVAVVTSPDNTAVDDDAVNNTAIDDSTLDDTSVDNPAVDDTSVDNPAGDDSAVDDASVENPDVNDSTVDNTAVDETSVDNAAVDDTTVENTEVDDTTVDNTDDVEYSAMETSDPKTPEVSIRTRQTTLETYLEKIRKDIVERKQKSEVAVKNLLTAPKRDMSDFYRASIKRLPRNNIASKPRVIKSKPSAIPLDRIPEEILQDMKYKPPKRFMKNDASWITKRLYKYLETKLEPKYDFKARVKAEKLVEHLYRFTKYIQKLEQAPKDSIKELKIIMARLDIVVTHHEFYEFFYEFMPREVRIKVVPNITNKLAMPKHGIFNEIIRAER